MAKFIKIFLPATVLLLMVVLPVIVFAQLVPCGHDKDCTFVDLFKIAGNIAKLIIWGMGLPLCGLAITYGGILITTSGSKPANKEKGKGIVLSAVFGLAIVFASYMIVDTILTTFTTKTLDGVKNGPS